MKANSTTDRFNRYFKEEEYCCPCGCCFENLHQELKSILLMIREYYNAPLYISSGCRCVEHNEKVGGAKRSKHLTGMAADINVKGVLIEELYNLCCKIFGDEWGGIGIYDTHVHIDVREYPARWDNRR